MKRLLLLKTTVKTSFLKAASQSEITVVQWLKKPNVLNTILKENVCLNYFHSKPQPLCDGFLDHYVHITSRISRQNVERRKRMGKRMLIRQWICKTERGLLFLIACSSLEKVVMRLFFYSSWN